MIQNPFRLKRMNQLEKLSIYTIATMCFVALVYLDPKVCGELRPACCMVAWAACPTLIAATALVGCKKG